MTFLPRAIICCYEYFYTKNPQSNFLSKKKVFSLSVCHLEELIANGKVAIHNKIILSVNLNRENIFTSRFQFYLKEWKVSGFYFLV